MKVTLINVNFKILFLIIFKKESFATTLNNKKQMVTRYTQATIKKSPILILNYFLL